MPPDPSQRHTLGSFDTALTRLREDLLVMGSLAVRNLDNAVRGLLLRDDQIGQLSIADDEEVDELEKRVDHDGFQIILRFQPVASDLRAVIAAMKVAANLERVADLAVSIARRARRLNRADRLPETPMLEPIFNFAQSMVRDSLRAFADNDVQLAREIKARDQRLDGMVTELTERLTTVMEQGGPTVGDYLNLILIARSIERLGDHAKNIAEDAVFSVSAEDIRHDHLHRPPRA